MFGRGIAAPAPNIYVTPAGIDFGEVVENQSASTGVYIDNTGNEVLIITDITLGSGIDFGLDAGDCGSSVAAGENCMVTVSFNPTSGSVVGMEFSDTLIIESNDQDSPVVNVSLSGTGLADSDGDGVPDRDEDVASRNDPAVATPPSATATGTITIATSTGTLSQVQALLDTDVIQANRPANISFPDGLVSFRVVGLTPGETVTIDIIFPTPFPATGARYFLADANGFTELTSVVFSGNVVTLTKTDGGNGDLDGVADGVITDPGGWAIPVATSSGGGGGGGSASLPILILFSLAYLLRSYRYPGRKC